MKFRVKKRTAILLGVLFLLLIFVFAVYVPFYKQLLGRGRQHGLTVATPAVPAYVKRYPAINYLFYLPDTEKGLIEEVADMLCSTGTESERLNKAKDLIEHAKKQATDLDDAKFEFVTAFASDTWECEIENNNTVPETPLTGSSQLWLQYFMESYRTGILVDKLKFSSGTRNFEFAGKIILTPEFSMLFPLKYNKSLIIKFNLKDIPDNLEMPLKLSGITVGLFNYFGYSEPAFKAECKISNIWQQHGKELSNRILRKNDIKIFFDKIIPAKEGESGVIIFTMSKPYNTQVKLEITQGTDKFKYKYFRSLGASNTVTWQDKFDFSKPATLQIKINKWVKIGECALKLEMDE